MKRTLHSLILAAALVAPVMANAHEGFANREEVIHQTAY